MTQILVLDGNDDSRKELCDLLREIGMEDCSLEFTEDDLICCTDIDEALDIINTGRVALVISDASDAEMQGYSICSLLNVHPGTKVILKVHVGDLGPITSAAAIRVHGVIDKPVDKEEISFYIKTALKIRFHNEKLDDILQKMKPGNLVCSECPVAKENGMC